MTRTLPTLPRPSGRVARIVTIALIGMIVAVGALLTGQGAPTTAIAALVAAAGATGWSAAGGIRPDGRRPQRRPLTVRVLLAVLAVVVGSVLLVAAIALAVAPGPFLLMPGPTSQYRPTVVAGLIAVLLGLTVGARAAYDSLRAPQVTRRTVALAIVLVLLVALAAQLRLAWALLQYPPFDATQIFSAAYSAAVAPTPHLFDERAQSAYFTMLPNNAFLAAAWSVAFSAFHAVGVTGIQTYVWITVIVNCLAIDIAVLLTWFVARRIGSRFTASVTLGVAVVLLVVSPWLTVPYSDTLGVALPIGAVAVFVAWPSSWPNASRLALWALLGALTAVGYSIKPTIVFASMGLLVAELLRADGRGLRRLLRIVPLGLTFSAVLLIGHLIATRWIDATDVLPFSLSTNDGALPFTHFMAMGATGDGGYNQADVDNSLAMPPAERSSTNLSLYLDRAAAMGAIGYPLFLGKKMLAALSDGSFFQGREGVGQYDLSYFHADSLSATVQTIYPDFTPLHWILSSTWQAAWIVVVLLCLVPLGRTLPEARRPIIAAIRVSVLLMLVFLLFSESRSRYLYLYLPFLLVLAGLGARSFTDACGSQLARLRRGRRSSATDSGTIA